MFAASVDDKTATSATAPTATATRIDFLLDEVFARPRGALPSNFNISICCS